MGDGKFGVRRVRRYRVARYPSRWPGGRARRGGSPGRRALRAAAGPMAALGIGAGGGACVGGISLVGDEADAAADDSLCADYTHTSPIAVGDCYVRYLTEAEGRELIRDVAREETAFPSDPCERPTLDERLRVDVSFPGDADPDPPIARIDLLAAAVDVEPTPSCPGDHRPAVGFEFLTDEAGDDEDLSGNGDGLSDAEEAFLGTLRARRAAGIAAIRATDHAYVVVETVDGRTDDSDRLRAEESLRETVRALLDDLRRDGMI